MCGICGVLNVASSTRVVDEEILKRMTDVLIHRGPDDSGMYVSPDKKIGFGFRRLSIIDLSPAGHQPMCNEKGDIWIMLNGEIYNHLTLRKILEKKHTYRSRSDTETLIHAYEEYGERFIDAVDGMFAIALWDEKKKKLLLYRDRIGKKPIYYTFKNGKFLFASEIKSLLVNPDLTPQVNEIGLYHYFTFLHTPVPYTLFHGINKLEPGNYIVVDKNGNISRYEYWDAIVPKGKEPYNDENYCIDQIRDLLLRAIEKRMMSDVPFGVFLSGGIDSSTNVALMSKLMTRPVDTFTVAIKGQDDVNEMQYARQIVKEFKANPHEIIIDDNDFMNLIPLVIYHQDEPLADPVCFPLYYVSKLARDNGTIVIQVGEGSDEQFLGYGNFLRILKLYYKYGSLKKLPKLVKRSLYKILIPFLIAQKVDYRQNIIRNLLYDDELFWGNAIAFYEHQKELLFNTSFRNEMKSLNSFDLVFKAFYKLQSKKDPDYAEKMIYWEFKNRLPELLLMRVDKMTMATSVEARVPFLDYNLVEFSMNIPWNLKVKNNETKNILKKAVEGIIPNNIIYRKKIGFTGSSKNMLTNKIYKFSKDVLLNYKYPYLNKEYIKDLLYEYENSGINYTPHIWCLLNFVLWHEYWIKGNKNIM
jgi:asparagine synthase (glutamine-hydrolysing)